MGSVDSKHSRVAKTEKLVSVDTADLKERLNRVYRGLRSHQPEHGDGGRFDYLWDLKELALLEGRQSVDVPEKWLDELENKASQKEFPQGH